MPTIKITDEPEVNRLDRTLAKITRLSRSKIQSWIRSEKVKVNSVVAKSRTLVQNGDRIEYPNEEHKKKIVESPSLTILFENDDLLVIDKPAGVIVHETTQTHTRPNIVDALIAHDPKIAHVGDDPRRPGIVHRLDKDASGVMVIAKTPSAFEHLKLQFKNRLVYKEYLALLYGSLSKDHDMLKVHIARSKTTGKMIVRPISQEGKEAITEYEVIQRFVNATFIRVILHTGRTHQIRATFRALNHPIVGDRLYGADMKQMRSIEFPRLFLHAHQLGFTLLDGTKKTFESPLPEELMHLLKVIK